jgi:hypothetical protein
LSEGGLRRLALDRLGAHSTAHGQDNAKRHFVRHSLTCGTVERLIVFFLDFAVFSAESTGRAEVTFNPRVFQHYSLISLSARCPMQSPASPAPAPRSPLLFRPVLQSLYTQNPFYLLSAGLILYGLHVSFRPEAGQLVNPSALMVALCGYTLLLALTAYLIVRLGRVWEDARSLVLVLLLMFLAVSVSFDEIINTSPAQGRGLLLFGLGFSTAISETLLRGLSLRMPSLYRVPYYAILTLFYVFPLYVSPEVTELPAATIDRRILLFTVAAGAVFLGLIPAIRRGASYARNDESPWRWPWYPWTAFGFLALGVCLRSYGLSYSFSPARGMESTFGPYYLVPFLLALLVLLLEFGIVERIRRLRYAAMCLAPGLVFLSIPGDSGSAAYRTFLMDLVDSAGSPVYFTVVGLVVFYAYGWLRGMKHSEWGLIAAFLLACIVGRQTVGLTTLTAPQWWPLAALGAVQLWLGVVRFNSARCFAAAMCLIAASSIALKETAFVAWSGAIPLHLALASMLAIGLVFHDRFAIVIRRLGAVALPVFCVLAAGAPAVAAVSPMMRIAYLGALAMIAVVYWRLAGDRWFLVAGCINAASGMLASVSTLQGAWSRSVGSRGFQPLAWGAACFALAALISAMKGSRSRPSGEERGG